METKTYKYKIYQLNDNKKKRLEELMRTAAWIYNHCLALHERSCKLYGKVPSNYTMKHHVVKIRKRCYRQWKAVDAQAAECIVDKVYNGYNLFYKGENGKPKFKHWTKIKSITYRQNGYTLNGNTLTLHKQKLRLKFHFSRPIEGKIQTVCVSRDAVGDWWVSFTVRKEEQQPTMTRTGKAVGVDFGLTHYLTLSDGTKIESPQYLKAMLDELRKRQRNLSRKENGSNGRKKAKLDVARLHRRISNLRRNFHWDLANRLAAEYDTICIETLDIKSMQQRWGRKVGDMAFSDFTSILGTVCKKQGKTLIKIDRWEATSKTCSECGYKADDLPLDIRKWMCPECGTRHDRDINAAKNILRVGLNSPTPP